MWETNMSKTLVVQTGDCLINVSRQEGFFWETLWNHPQNADLRRCRKQYNIIKKGDQLFIPDKQIQEFSRPTDQRHCFVRKGLTVRFTLTLLDLGQPRANLHYILTVKGVSREGCTDAAGTLSEPIPADARDGRLLLGDKREEIHLDFGCIDPIEEISGVKSRLRNLGFYDGEIDDDLTPETTAAIAEFQRSTNLSGEGELTDETRDALVEAHGN
jgi:hypothetical protein